MNNFKYSINLISITLFILFASLSVYLSLVQYIHPDDILAFDMYQKIKYNGDLDLNSYRKVYGKVLESDTKKGRFIVSEYGSTGENKEKMIYDFNQKQKFMDIDDPFSFERCK